MFFYSQPFLKMRKFMLNMTKVFLIMSNFYLVEILSEPNSLTIVTNQKLLKMSNYVLILSIFFLKMRIRNLQCEAWGYSIIPPWMKLIYGSWNGSTAKVHKCSTEKVSTKCIRKYFCRSHLLDKFADLQLRNLIKKTSTRRWVLDVLWNFKVLNFKF